MERKTNLFVVGAMKAGTTSFTELLAQHPDIYSPPVKEPHYFIDGLPLELYDPGPFFNLNNYLQNIFPEPLHITKIKTEAQYESVFSLAGEEKYRSDTSTAYLHAIEAASKIQKYNSQARIIILLRDPVRRAFSHYKMDVGKGRVNESFESCIQRDILNYSNNTLPWFSYLGMSLYNKSVHRFKEMFPNVMVVQFEDLIARERKTLKAIASFLEIGDFKNSSISHTNIARKPKYPRLYYVLNKIGFKHYFSKIFSGTFKQWLAAKASSKEPFEMQLSEITRLELEQIFKKESTI